MNPSAIVPLLDKLYTEVDQAFLPHYKEDAFRVLIVSAAFQNGWRVAEPRQENGSLVPAGKAAVYETSWAANRFIRKATFVEKSPTSKPDVRLHAPDGANFRVETKVGMTGSASASNSNASKVAADIDLVANRECEIFVGLFDEGMLDRLQGRFSSAGRGAEMRVLLGGVALNQLDATGKPSEVKSVWGGTAMLTGIRHVTCRSGVALAFMVVRRQASGF